MIILSIETSCDETAVSIVETTGDAPDARYTVLGNAIFSQIEMHREYGGVFPNVAKRAHAETLVPMLEKALGEANLASLPHAALFPETKAQIVELLSREHGLADAIFSLYERYNTPHIDLIAVTRGPGLEPALWVGINFAKALSMIWNIPVIGVNHMEGHIFASVFDGTHIAPVAFPAIALLISGGHTELVLMRSWRTYELVGRTRDDAVGEAFDKVARMLGLPYPGGPEISIRAARNREKSRIPEVDLPRPMLHSNDCDFSFSGLKTAVLYHLKNRGDAPLTEEVREAVARAFEDAATDVLIAKTTKAIEAHGARSLILGGGVSANRHIRATFADRFKDADVALYLPERTLTTDNSVMIALAAHAQYAPNAERSDDFKADGNLSMSSPT